MTKELVVVAFAMLLLLVMLSLTLVVLRTSLARRRRRRRRQQQIVDVRRELVDHAHVRYQPMYQEVVAEVETMRDMQQQVRSQMAALQRLVTETRAPQPAPLDDDERDKRE